MKYLWKVYKIWIVFGLLFVGLTLVSVYFLNRFYRFSPPTDITIQDFIYASTGIIILFYTIITWQTLSQLRRSQSLNTLSDLTHYYNQISRTRINIFTKEDMNVIEDVPESDLTKLSNFLDGFGHITYRLPFEDQNIAIERWAETFIRSWIRLNKFVEKKRPDSIMRDYPFFQWLASKSFEFHRKNYQGCPVKFYKYNQKKDLVYSEIWRQDGSGFYLNDPGNRVVFVSSEKVEKDFIENKKRVITFPTIEMKTINFTTA